VLNACTYRGRGSLLYSLSGVSHKNNRIRKHAVCGKGHFMPEIEQKNEVKSAARDKKLAEYLRSIGVSEEGVAAAIAIK